MMYHRSFNRFILISLALLGLSVSSANAALMSGDSTFGVDSITLDLDSGLEWLDLTYSVDISFDDMTTYLSEVGNDFEGWRYASGQEVANFWTSGGGTDPYDGSADQWVEGVLGYWGHTAGKGTAYFLTSDVYPCKNCPYVLHWYGMLADYSNGTGAGSGTFYATPFSGTTFGSTVSGTRGSALVRVTVVPVPAAIWLFGTALIGLVGYGKRKSKVPV